MDIQKTIKQADENKRSGKDKQERTTYRNLFERIKPDEKEKIKEKIDKKEINDYTEEDEVKIGLNVYTK